MVSGTVDEPFGMQGHMSESALARLLEDTGAINTALLRSIRWPWRVSNAA